MKCHDKVIYLTLDAALDFCRRVFTSSGRIQQPYQCQHCRQFHLTSHLNKTDKRSMRLYLEAVEKPKNKGRYIWYGRDSKIRKKTPRVRKLEAAPPEPEEDEE